MYENLKVTAYLQCGAITDAYCPLDGILYYQGMRDRYGPQDYTVPGGHTGQNPLTAQVVPLQKLNPGPAWYYACSFAQWSHPSIEAQDYWNKRFDNPLADLVDFGGKRGKVIVEQGRYKAYHMPVYYRHALSVSWYVVGNKQRIEELLSTCTHIGKKIAQGWGAVLRWDVQPFRHDWSVTGPNGELMRAIPDPNGDGHYGIRPSYWMANNQCKVRLPHA